MKFLTSALESTTIPRTESPAWGSYCTKQQITTSKEKEKQEQLNNWNPCEITKTYEHFSDQFLPM